MAPSSTATFSEAVVQVGRLTAHEITGPVRRALSWVRPRRRARRRPSRGTEVEFGRFTRRPAAQGSPARRAAPAPAAVSSDCLAGWSLGGVGLAHALERGSGLRRPLARERTSSRRSGLVRWNPRDPPRAARTALDTGPVRRAGSWVRPWRRTRCPTAWRRWAWAAASSGAWSRSDGLRQARSPAHRAAGPGQAGASRSAATSSGTVVEVGRLTTDASGRSSTGSPSWAKIRPGPRCRV